MALMDFHLHRELHATSDDYASDEFEYEDDVFYSELRKQVLQLTAEEDEEADEEDDRVVDEESRENKSSETVAAKQGLKNVKQICGLYSWPESKEEDNLAPKWMSNMPRNTNGTGVFIPQIVPAQKRNRPRKKKGGKGKSQKAGGKKCDLI